MVLKCRGQCNIALCVTVASLALYKGHPLARIKKPNLPASTRKLWHSCRVREARFQSLTTPNQRHENGVLSVGWYGLHRSNADVKHDSVHSTALFVCYARPVE